MFSINPWLFPLLLCLNALKLGEAVAAESLKTITASLALVAALHSGDQMPQRWEGNVCYPVYGRKCLHRYSIDLAPIIPITDKKYA